MKKLLCIFISIILCFSFGMTAFAEEDDTAPILKVHRNHG